MKKIRFTALILLVLGMVLCAQIAMANEAPRLSVDNPCLTTNDIDATYIEGSVSNACGQKLIVKKGMQVVAEKAMPNTGEEASFRIKVPSELINKNRVNVFRVKEMDTDEAKTISKARVEINYVEREQQKISTDKKTYNLTFPGLDAKIKAKATSGEKLLYTSDNPDVVKVDSSGKLTASGAGDATVTVKQIGSGKYNETEEKLNVKVEAVDAYTITYHSSDDKNAIVKQIVETGKATQLQENTFENGDHEFLGWAKSDDGLAEFVGDEEVKELAKTGENVDLYAVWSGDGIRGAIAWAVKIANDDSFSYGHIPETSSTGCYFCGTSQTRKPRGYEKTYVCLTFITAAYAHGAEDPEMLRDCTSGRNCLVVNDDNFRRYSCWQKVGYARNLSISDLEPGDVICNYSPGGYDNGHISMYMGDNRLVDSEDIDGYWGPNSIAVREGGGSTMLRAAANHSPNSYVMRYVGPKREQ